MGALHYILRSWPTGTKVRALTNYATFHERFSEVLAGLQKDKGFCKNLMDDSITFSGRLARNPQAKRATREGNGKTNSRKGIQLKFALGHMPEDQVPELLRLKKRGQVADDDGGEPEDRPNKRGRMTGHGDDEFEV